MKTEIEGQINLFDLLEPEKPKRDLPHILAIGDKVGRVVLGECRVATVIKVEGLPNYPFYRTDSGGCYNYEEGLQNIESLIKLAEQERQKYKTVIPQNLEERITIEYKPHSCDGKILWAQIGIFNNMLFWKDSMTYQFLEPYTSEKKLMAAYQKRKKEMLEHGGTIVSSEKEMRRLYWSRRGFYADAEYVRTNG